MHNNRLPGYTSHGHPIEGLIQLGTPETVARCGGPALCVPCAQEAIRAREELDHGYPIIREGTVTHVLMVYRHAKQPGAQWQVMLVSPENSAITNGTYDLIEYYRNSGRWDVHTQTIELPE